MMSLINIIRNTLSKGYIFRAAPSPTLRAFSNQANDSLITSENDEPIEIENPFKKDKLSCILCKMQITPDYKNVRLLSQFQSSYTGRIYGRHITGLCKGKQELVEKEITKAQVCGLMPTYHKHTDFLDDPRLFDPERSIRPHKY